MAEERPRPGGRRARRDDRSRDLGLGDDSVESAGLGSSTPTPDPLAHGSAEVDQARMAESGAARGGSGEVRDEDLGGPGRTPAPDAVEGDAVGRGERDPAVLAEAGGAPTRSRNRLIAFLGHSVDELRRVQWPDRRQVAQATAVVLGFVVIAGGYLGLMDALWKPLVNAIL